MKKILVIGNGGREHALAWKLKQSNDVAIVYVAPGNAGTEQEAGIENVAIASDDIDALLSFAQTQRIDLTVVGPEAPLVAGIVDQFQAADMAIFGPRKFNAQLEGSKSFAKQFMQEYGIPTAAYGEFTAVAPALDFLSKQALPIVIKADGLAAGKGVVIAQTLEQAQQAVHEMLSGKAHGAAGQKIVIEEFLYGQEISFICMVDHDVVIPLATSQDHKARDDGDLGPNTGGMGAYSPAPLVDDAMHQRIMREVIKPTAAGFMASGQPFQGFLYACLMISDDGIPKVLEYNCRFGDPETQPIMQRLRSDLTALCLATAKNELQAIELDWDPRSALAVVLAAGGYPFDYAKGEVISGLAQDHGSDCKVFHAGTTKHGEDIVTAGGRVLSVSALGDDIAQAQARAYQAVATITWPYVYFRHDIGHRAIAAEE